MLDRVMRSMNGYFDGGQHLHGKTQAAQRHARAWHCCTTSLLGTRDGACQRLPQPGRAPQTDTGIMTNWLHNLLVSASLAGFRHRNSSPHKA